MRGKPAAAAVTILLLVGCESSTQTESRAVTPVERADRAEPVETEPEFTITASHDARLAKRYSRPSTRPWWSRDNAIVSAAVHMMEQGMLSGEMRDAVDAVDVYRRTMSRDRGGKPVPVWVADLRGTFHVGGRCFDRWLISIDPRSGRVLTSKRGTRPTLGAPAHRCPPR